MHVPKLVRVCSEEQAFRYSPYPTCFRLGYHVVVLGFCVVRVGIEPTYRELPASVAFRRTRTDFVSNLTILFYISKLKIYATII